MNEIFAALRQFFRGLRPYFTVAPWEQALRVRAGKHVKLLSAGIHLKLPIVDTVYVQTVRRRVASVGRQTVTTRLGQAVTFSASVGYAIGNIETLYRTLHHAEDTIGNLVRSSIAHYIATHELRDCWPAKIEAAMLAQLDLGQYGLVDVAVFVTEFAVVRTFRLIGDAGGYMYGGALSTSTPHDSNSGGPPS